MILGFDTSGPYCGAALFDGDDVIAAAHEEMAKGQAERLMLLLEEVLEEGGVGWKDLARIGVGIGPGNFTGIRISVAAARGLALSLGIPAIGVSILDAAAFGADGAGVITMDARREHVYLQGFGGYEPTEPGLFSLEEAGPFLPPRTTVIGTAAQIVEDRYGCVRTPAAFAPGSAIARVAALREPGQRPAPLYLRAPDAAPPRNPAPQIIP